MNCEMFGRGLRKLSNNSGPDNPWDSQYIIYSGEAQVSARPEQPQRPTVVYSSGGEGIAPASTGK